LGIIVFGRALGTMVFIKLLEIFGYQSKMSFKQLVFVWYAGMIRGAIAFGLVLRIDAK